MSPPEPTITVAADPAMLAAQLAAIVESSEDAIVGKDLDGVVTSWNAGAEHIFGFRAEEMIGQPFARVIPEDRLGEEASILARIARGERVGHFETVRLRKDGQPIFVSVTVSPIRDGSGRVVGASKIARDITARRLADQRAEWLASFPERNPNPIVEVDAATGEPYYMNPFARRLFPDLPEKLREHPLLADLCDVVQTLRGGETDAVRREVAVGEVWFAQTITLIAEAARVRIYSSDVTSRRHAEQRLRLSEFSVENAAVAIYLAGSDARILRVNRATCAMLGYTPEELCALSIPDLAPDFPVESWPLQWEALRAESQVVLETTNRRKDGHMLPVEVEVKLIEFEGREYIFACVHDITDRRRVASLIAGQRDLLDKIANRHPLPETLEDAMRFAERQVAGMLCSFLYFDAGEQVLRHGAAPSLPEAYNRAIDGVRIGPDVGSCGTAAYRREPVVVRDIASDPLWANYRELAAQYDLAACWSTPVFGSDGGLLGTFAIYFRESREPEAEHHELIDIITQTAAVAIERARSEEKIRSLNADLERRVEQRTQELEEANRELESFSYSVSHDLRAPLRHVLGYVEMLQRTTEGMLSEKASRYLKIITEATEEMGELIDDLLAFSRMGRTEMKAETVNLGDLVRQVVAGLEMATRGRQIEWKIEPLPSVIGDSAMLKLVLMNLIGNAVKYTRPRNPARIEIGWAIEKPGLACVFVRDNGVGFDMQYVHKLFGVFQRLHRQEEFEGTGIGLATVRRILARHGGSVCAHGEVGRGAVFDFSVRLASAK